MRIAVITDLWPPFPGGAERFIFNVARELKNRGHEIHVLTSYANAAEFDGIKPTWVSIGVHCYDHQPGHTHLDGWRDIVLFLERVQADIVLTHHFFADEFKVELFGNWPTIQIVHNGQRNPKATWAIYNSEYTRQRANAQPLDLTILPPAFEDCRAEEHGPFIGFVKPIPHKGSEFFYKVAARLQDRDFMVLHGEWHETEDVRRGIHNVFFMPPVHDIKTFYEKCRIMLMPSLHEDAGTIPQEAAINGLPCISSNVMGLPETNSGGILLPHVVDSWVAAIRDLDNPRYYDEVASRQQTFIRELNSRQARKFDWLSQQITKT
jgi:glycosyltransferase involved in cell wall biosynthesis